MACVDWTTSLLMTPLIMSNVLSIRPLDTEPSEEDDGLKAGVAPNNQETVGSLEFKPWGKHCLPTINGYM